MRYRRPRSLRRGLISLGWLALCLLALILIGAAVIVSLSWVKVPQSAQFPGQVEHVAEGLALEWPAGIPVGHYVVEPGEAVSRGQTIMALDREVIAAQLAIVRRRILAASVERECLLTGNGADDATLEAHAPEDPEARLQLRQALENCRLVRGQGRDGTAWIRAALTHMQERRRLLEQALTATFAEAVGPDTATPPSEAKGGAARDATLGARARRALALSLERNALEERIVLLRGTLAERTNAARARLLERVESLRRQNENDIRIEALLERFRNAPRVPAPSDGIISRLRPVAPGSVFAASFRYGEIRTESAAEPRVAIYVPPRQNGAVGAGQSVTVQVAGVGPAGGTFEGRVARIEPARRLGLPGGQIATIVLHGGEAGESGTARLEHVTGGADAIVRVERAPTTLLARIEDSAVAALPPRRFEVWQRLARLALSHLPIPAPPADARDAGPTPDDGVRPVD